MINKDTYAGLNQYPEILNPVREVVWLKNKNISHLVLISLIEKSIMKRLLFVKAQQLKDFELALRDTLLEFKEIFDDYDRRMLKKEHHLAQTVLVSRL